MKAFKAFNHDWSCRDFKFEIGKTYVHDGEIKLCSAGFHACEAPLDVLSYYPPTANFAEVDLDGVSDEKENDTKRVAKSITIKAPLNISGLVSAQIEWCKSKSDANIASGYASTAASSGNYSTAASSGNYSTAASSGYASKAASSGYASTAASSGNHSKAASSGNHSKAASSGNYSKAASSGYASTAASSGNHSKAASSGYASTAASSGNASTAASSGYASTAASSGNYSTAEASGKKTISMVAGIGGRSRAGELGAFALPYMDGEQVRILVGVIGENGIKADTWYCVDDGRLVEVKQ